MDNGLTNNIDPFLFRDYSGSCFFQAAERYPNIYEYDVWVFTQIEVEMQMDS